MYRIVIEVLDDPALAIIGAAAARRGQDLLIAISSTLTFRERRIAAYELMGDDEFDQFMQDNGLARPVFRSVPVQKRAATSPCGPAVRAGLGVAAHRRAV